MTMNIFHKALITRYLEQLEEFEDNDRMVNRILKKIKKVDIYTYNEMIMIMKKKQKKVEK